ncbi:PREDICTED: uncharacterized protein LOC109206629 isoform X2 [Nicotiana attenuata]|uniref:uncharacterized protein LOC109206629 isoform X2 n=1 Tax=Nicotiana attenuata TaxID=49451 RepID=UPI0009054D22|nr:PREDICTED: uncharacterized protein LOC109206629 isoform X2 [Nicotiana attenuata]
MAKNLDDYDFWLPSQFLTDDDLLMDFKVSSIVEGRNDGVKYLARDFQNGLNPFGLHSDLNSPVESAVGSVDTESDEEEYITELTRKMAHSTLHESGFGYQNTKGWSLLGSPQSTLCGCKQGSSSESPNCPSQASSPPPMNRNDRAFDLLYAAADEVARLRMMEDAAGLYQTKNGLSATPRKTTVPVPPNNSKPCFGSLKSNQLSYQQFQVAQRLKQQQIMKQGQGVLGSVKGGFGQYLLNQNNQKLGQSRGQNGVARPMNSSISSWPTLQQSQQQQPGSGMHAVFLGNPGPKKECAGTGVFLPRGFGTQTETKKKPGNTTVLLPDRVVQALNLNLGAMDARSHTPVQPRCYNGGSGSIPASGSKSWNNMAATQQRNNSRTENTYSQRATMPQELLLPQDWTY